MLENDMNKLIIFLLVATFSVTGYCEKVKMNDLTERNGIYFKKSSKDPFTGELEGRYQGRIVDGKRDGLWLTYSPDGNLWFKKNYVNGIIDGISFMYHNNGELRSKSLYDMGVELSTEEYDKKGKLRFKLEFEKDKNGKIINAKKSFPDGTNRTCSDYNDCYKIE